MFVYKPFKPLHISSNRSALPGDVQLKHIEDLLKNRHWNDAVAESMGLIKDSLEGLKYLQT